MSEQPRAALGALVRTLLSWEFWDLPWWPVRNLRWPVAIITGAASTPVFRFPWCDRSGQGRGADRGRRNRTCLYSRNADAERHPASLTKMMTLYLLFESLKRGDVTMQTMLPISEHAATQHPTNLHLYAGDMIPVDTAIKAIVVRSANDVAVAIAESLGGTESHFAELMTAKARALACGTRSITTPRACPIRSRSRPPATSSSWRGTWPTIFRSIFRIRDAGLHLPGHQLRHA